MIKSYAIGEGFVLMIADNAVQVFHYCCDRIGGCEAVIDSGGDDNLLKVVEWGSHQRFVQCFRGVHLGGRSGVSFPKCQIP